MCVCWLPTLINIEQPKEDIYFRYKVLAADKKRQLIKQRIVPQPVVRFQKKHMPARIAQLTFMAQFDKVMNILKILGE